MKITTEQELRELIGVPGHRAATKDRQTLHPRDREWLAASPFCLIATADADGRCDVSPKGDPAGFVHIIDDSTIAVPERPGNKRMDGFLNMVANPHVGLIFFIPGRPDTLRVNGRASLVADADYFDKLVVKGHRPVLAVEVEIEQVFLHCPKAFLRSSLWRPQTWAPDAVVPHPQMIKDVQASVTETLDELVEYYGPSYEAGMYQVK